MDSIEERPIIDREQLIVLRMCDKMHDIAVRENMFYTRCSF